MQVLVCLWDLGNGTGHSVFRPKLTGINATSPELAAVGRPDGPDKALAGAILTAQPLKSLALHSGHVSLALRTQVCMYVFAESPS